MNLESYQKGKVQVVRLSGRFDAFEVPVLTVWLDKSVTADNANVVINLDAVEFIDSSGLAALVKVLKRCRENKGNLALCNVQQAVTIIFELTNLNKAFEVYDTEADALKAFDA